MQTTTSLHLLAGVSCGRRLRIVDFEALFGILVVLLILVISRVCGTGRGLELLLV